MLSETIINLLRQIDEQIENNTVEVPAVKLGLDYRCAKLLVDFESKDIYCRRHDRQRLNYYGGFEYVDSEHITEIGDYVLFNNDSPRVQRCFAAFYETWLREHNDQPFSVEHLIQDFGIQQLVDDKIDTISDQFDESDIDLLTVTAAQQVLADLDIPIEIEHVVADNIKVSGS